MAHAATHGAAKPLSKAAQRRALEAEWEAQREEREWRRLEDARAAERKKGEWEGPKLGPQRPHPQSYRPDLPLRETENGWRKFSADEKSQLALRPIVVRRVNVGTLIAAKAKEIEAAAGPDFWTDKAKKTLAPVLRQHERLDGIATQIGMVLEERS